MPWEDRISLLTVDGMREHSTRLRNELKSFNLSTPSRNCLQIVLHNLESLMENYHGIGPSTQVFFEMMYRRIALVIGIHSYNEVKSRVTKEMA